MSTPKAFPHTENGIGGETYHIEEGMNLRDYFAAQIVGHVIPEVLNTDSINPKLGPTLAAQVAYQIADAMLEVRCK